MIRHTTAAAPLRSGHDLHVLTHCPTQIKDRGAWHRRRLALLREELIPDVAKGLELDRISAGIQQEHCGLFADFSLKPRMRFDNELHTAAAQAFR